MNSRVFRILFAAALLPLAQPGKALAEDEKKAPAPYVLKKRSTFTVTNDEQRAPFWPIGWTKRKLTEVAAAPVQVVIEPKVAFDASSVKVTSILLGTPSLAIVNGRSYTEGDFLRQPKSATGSPAPRVRVYRIEDGVVTLQHQEQLYPVHLQRPELVQRGPGEELLTEDRP